MGQRHMHCTYQMPFLEAEHGQRHFYQDMCISQSCTVDFPNQSMCPAMTIGGHYADPNHNQVRDHVGRDMLYGNSQDILHNHSHAANMIFAGPSPSNFDSHPSSSSRFFSAFQNDGNADGIQYSGASRMVEVNASGFGMQNYFADSDRGSCKRKIAEMMPGNYSDINRFMSSSVSVSSPYLSLNSGQPQLNGTHEHCFNLSNSTCVTPPGYMGNVILPTTERSHRSMRTRSTFDGHKPELAILHHNNYLVQGDFMSQTFQAANNSCIEQFGGYVGEARHSNWTNPHSVTHLRGRCPNSRDAEMVNFDMQGHQRNLLGENAAIPLHPAPTPNFHLQVPAQNVQMQSTGHHTHIPGSPYQLPFHNLYPGFVNPSLDALDSGYRFLPFSSSSELIYRTSWQQLPTAVEVNQRNLRILSPEDAAVEEFSEIYGIEDAIDRHRDMRLDIDNMTYEELLALEERIGDVNTGLTEQSILKNLKTSIHTPQLASSRSDQSSNFTPENETCPICQVEFEENERLGTLDCGHKYHADCVKQWLLVKNICPICKTSALDTDKRDK
ncbi:Zinc finger RING/FYVE/PHD-type protein [Dioscorea alata]|uniref:Zinc finger RING/FYVE/PHD-type protein n=4 Tax=Dioscorea alata TaxID=55571 RepID=A0ACB7TTD3_DIOAL|nr:Zinc finger RING/FYVE/PHD-type protein [Dioscorea alata]KAH7651879.1 Zinc finger RING/FYVE/PHD-type protein [Dioscorea alata]KAH7651880.1 Zinc finger RING/FYVE/PHD-type protein [Dioscorea alata]KAH7651881.1 Zinc finger RING/FYVE/PHD-type protein [Dioscorea alata]